MLDTMLTRGTSNIAWLIEDSTGRLARRSIGEGGLFRNRSQRQVGAIVQHYVRG